MTDRPTSGIHIWWLASPGCGRLHKRIFPCGLQNLRAVASSSRRVPICEVCLQSFARIQGPLCAICGLPASTWSLAPLGQENHQPVDILIPKLPSRLVGLRPRQKFRGVPDRTDSGNRPTEVRSNRAAGPVVRSAPRNRAPGTDGS